MYFSTVNEWLDWIGSLHQSDIALGLERVRVVAERLGVLQFDCPVIIVGGTNGKGSTVAGLEAIYDAAGYRTGVFTSPMMFKPNEQVRIAKNEVSDQDLCHAFAEVAIQRGDVMLTPFEYMTLAAFTIFKQQRLDVLILEIGLGGRLDAVNILNANVAVITTIAMDHMDYLGDTRDAIAMEKAGIFRSGMPAVCGDKNPPPVISIIAENLDVPLYCQGKDFQYEDHGDTWSWLYDGQNYCSIPKGALAVQNLSTVLMVVTLLQEKLPVAEEVLKKSLAAVSLTGRIQVIPGDVTEIMDVSHNPAAAAFLADYLKAHPCSGKNIAVFSMLADKDIEGTIEVMKDLIYGWYVAPLTGKRAAGAKRLLNAFEMMNIDHVLMFTSIKAAYKMASQAASAGDRVVVFGSFHTVAEVHADLINKTTGKKYEK